MENKSSITARMSAFARAYHAETEARPVFRDTLAKDLMTPEEYDAVRGYLLSGAAFFEPQLEKLLERHGFLIYELLTPADIQRSMIDPGRRGHQRLRACALLPFRPQALKTHIRKMRQPNRKPVGLAFFVIRYLPARRRFLPPRPRAGYLRQS